MEQLMSPRPYSATVLDLLDAFLAYGDPAAPAVNAAHVAWLRDNAPARLVRLQNVAALPADHPDLLALRCALRGYGGWNADALRAARDEVCRRRGLTFAEAHAFPLAEFVEALTPDAVSPPPPQEDGDDWSFLPGRFRYRQDWYELGGRQLQLLQAFVQAEQMILSHGEIDEACGNDGRTYANVCDLNRSLRRLWKTRRNPIRSVMKAYRLDPP
jgi:hypothetical protein